MNSCDQDRAGQQESLDSVYQDFISGQLDPTTFSHVAHVYSAWRLLFDRGIEDAREEFRRLLRTYTLEWGVKDKFHYTITDAMILLIASHATGTATHDWPAFCSQAGPLFNSAESVLGRFYSDELLWSQQARQGPVQSDRADINLISHGASAEARVW